MAVWHCAARAIEHARNGEGPTLIEARTYRIRGHVEAEATFLGSTYRTDEEVEQWKARDPITAFAARLTDSGQANQSVLDAIKAEIVAEVEEAVDFAENSPYPDPADQNMTYMFAEAQGEQA